MYYYEKTACDDFNVWKSMVQFEAGLELFPTNVAFILHVIYSNLVQHIINILELYAYISMNRPF